MGLAVVAIVGCRKTQLENDVRSSHIQAVSTIENTTASKALISGTDVALPSLGFVRVEDPANNLGTYNFTGATPFGATRAVGGVMTFVPAQPYDQVNGKCSYLLGYGPDIAPVNDKVTWSVDGATDILKTDVWNAGTYTTSINTGMVFRHELARLEVVCQAEAGTALAIINSSWGDIESIKLKGTSPSLELDYATQLTAGAGTATDLTLLNGTSYTVGAFTPVAVPANGSTAINAASMVVATGTPNITLLVKTAKSNGEKEIPITLLANFDKGKVHTVTLTFKANGKDIECTTSTIEDWTTGTTGGGNVVETKPGPIVIFGQAPYAQTGGVTSSATSYAGYTLVSNGVKQVSAAAAYVAEPAYARLELAQLKEAATVDFATAYAACLAKGTGWRLPRVAEAHLMFANKTELEKVAGFDKLNATIWTGTESTTADQAFQYDLVGGTGTAAVTTGNAVVRCVKEIEISGPVITYGQAPYTETGMTSGSVTASYNAFVPDVDAGTNGVFYSSQSVLYANEKPFHKLEVDMVDASAASTWALAFTVCSSKGANWRLPRATEFNLIAINATALATVAGFTPLTVGGSYWTGSEKQFGQAWAMDDSGNGIATSRTSPQAVRCVREK